MKTIWGWITGLFAHPKTTVTGLGSLLGAASIGYGMNSGAVPINAQNIAIAGGLASAGLAGVFGADSKPVQAVNTLTAAAPVVDLVKSFQAAQLEASTAQDKINNFAAMTQMLAQVIPATPAAPVVTPVAVPPVEPPAAQ